MAYNSAINNSDYQDVCRLYGLGFTLGDIGRMPLWSHQRVRRALADVANWRAGLSARRK